MKQFTFIMALMLVASPALGENLKSSNPDLIAEKVRELGYRSIQKTGSDGDPYVISSANGDNFIIFFDGCKDGKNCEWIQFYASFEFDKKDYAKVRQITDEWSGSGNFSSTNISGEKISLNYYLVMAEEGVPGNLFAYNFNTWINELTFFRKNLNDKLN